MLPKEHVLMRILSDKVEREDVVRVLTIAARCKEAGDRELIRSVLEISAEANVKVFREVWEDESMGSALREIMKDDLDAKLEEGVEKGVDKATMRIVDLIQKNNVEGMDPVEVVMSTKDVSRKEAKAWMVRYAHNQ